MMPELSLVSESATDPARDETLPVASRGRLLPARRRWDGVSALTVYMMLLLGIPAPLVLAPIGGSGSPAGLFGLALLVWWIASFLGRAWPYPSPRQPLAWAMGAFIVAILLSYVAGMLRPITPLEIRAADRGVLTAMSWLGVFLVASDGIVTLDRLNTLLRRLALGLGLMAALGIAQSVTGRTLIDVVAIPGFSGVAHAVGDSSRGGMVRPAATAVHPIEFGVCMAIGVAVALYAAVELPHKSALSRWFPLTMVIIAIPLSISRSALIGLAAVLVAIVPTWPRGIRNRAYWLCAAGAVTLVAAKPSLAQQIFSLFSGIARDDSVSSRTDSYSVAWSFISKSPILGRGISTFLPDYRILDNQYLLIAIEAGVVGLITLVWLLVCGMLTGEQIRREATDQTTRQLGRTLTAMLAPALLAFAFFDGLSFPILSGLVFLTLGITAGARRVLWEMRKSQPKVDSIYPPPRSEPSEVP